MKKSAFLFGFCVLGFLGACGSGGSSGGGGQDSNPVERLEKSDATVVLEESVGDDEVIVLNDGENTEIRIENMFELVNQDIEAAFQFSNFILHRHTVTYFFNGRNFDADHSTSSIPNFSEFNILDEEDNIVMSLNKDHSEPFITIGANGDYQNELGMFPVNSQNQFFRSFEFPNKIEIDFSVPFNGRTYMLSTVIDFFFSESGDPIRATFVQTSNYGQPATRLNMDFVYDESGRLVRLETDEVDTAFNPPHLINCEIVYDGSGKYSYLGYEGMSRINCPTSFF